MAYTKHTWQCGEPITVAKLNHMENGIAQQGSSSIPIIEVTCTLPQSYPLIEGWQFHSTEIANFVFVTPLDEVSAILQSNEMCYLRLNGGLILPLENSDTDRFSYTNTVFHQYESGIYQIEHWHCQTTTVGMTNGEPWGEVSEADHYHKYEKEVT